MSGQLECRLEDRDGSFLGFSVSQVLCQKHSGLQNIEIVDSPAWGRVLILNGHQQFTPIDEAYSTEMRAHVPIYSFPHRPSSVLIIAGFSGTCLQELVKHDCFEEIVTVDLDPVLLDVCKTYFDPINSYAAPYQDPRVKVVIDDGLQYLRRCQEVGKKFDLIIRSTVVEKICSDHVKPLSSEGFYYSAQQCLTSEGILMLSTGIQTLNEQPARESLLQLRRFFRHAGLFTSTIPSFGQGIWTFTWASSAHQLNQIPLATLQKRFAKHPIPTQIYNPEFHWASFRLDNFHKLLLR